LEAETDREHIRSALKQTPLVPRGDERVIQSPTSLLSRLLKNPPLSFPIPRKSAVMRGLDARIHNLWKRMEFRVIGEQSDAVLRTTMPGNDAT
jgi:hypothetical protein